MKTCTQVLQKLVEASRHMTRCNERPIKDPGGCALLSLDSHYTSFKKALETAEQHLEELLRKPS